MKPRKQQHRDADVAQYWLTHDSADEIDWTEPGVRIEFDPEVERPTRPVTLRLPRRLLQELRVLAKDRDVPRGQVDAKRRSIVFDYAAAGWGKRM